MSVGFGGYAELVLSDDSAVLYKYCCYNVNRTNYMDDKANKDGEIFISRNAFIDPEIHIRKRKTPSGKKQLVAKRIIKDIPFDLLLSEEKIKVKNASGTWKTVFDEMDYIAYRLINIIFDEYQKTGTVLDKVSFFC